MANLQNPQRKILDFKISLLTYLLRDPLTTQRVQDLMILRRIKEKTLAKSELLNEGLKSVEELISSDHYTAEPDIVRRSE